MRSLTIPLAAFILTTASGSACARRDEAPSADTAARQPAALTITATDYAFDAPDTVPAGLTTVRLVNHGDQPHAASLVRLEAGRTLPEYIQAYREANRTKGPRPEWASFHGGPSALVAHSEGNATLYLEPGNYAWVCFVPGPSGIVHLLEHRQAHGFVVQPGSGETATSAPVPTGSIRMLDFSLELSAPIKAGRHVIRVENAGVEPHHVLLFKLAPGKSMEDVQAWMQSNMQGEPPAAPAGAMAEMSAGTEAWFELDLPAGDYVLVCLVAGRDEVPHIAKGMIQHIRVG
jgi:hypothetical protein